MCFAIVICGVKTLPFFELVLTRIY